MGTLVVTSKQGSTVGADSIAIYFAIAAYLVAVLPYLVHGYTALGLLCVVLSLWRIHITYVKAPPPSSDTTTIVGVAAIIVLAGLTELRLNPQSGVIALMVLIGCKNLAARTSAQFTNNLLLLPFLPMGLFLTVDPSWATGYLAAFLWIWLSGLVRIWQRNGALRTTLGQGLRVLGILAPMILLSYFMLPRPQAVWTQQEQEAKTGMSSTLKPGDVGRLSQNQDTAFFAKFDKLPMEPEQMYWRSLTLSHYADGEWSAQTGATRMPADWITKNNTTSDIPYKIVFSNKNDNFLYGLEYSSFAKGTMLRDGTASIPAQASRQSFLTYDAVYHPKAVMNLPPSLSEKAELQNDNPKATELAKSLWSKNPNADAFVLNLRDHIQQSGFVYSLEPGAMKDSWIDTFLERKKGFCEHYAGTTAYMLRQVGVPTRVVVGFQGAKPFSSTTYLDVPYSAAHAWLEYWNKATGAWVRLDPTGWVAPERLTAQHWEQTGGYKASWWGEFGFFATQMESQWKMWVTYYDADQQRELWRKMSKVDWTPFGLGLLGFLALGWFVTGKRWYALSPKPIHQWKWVLRNCHLSESTTTVAYKQHLNAKFLHVFQWLEHVEASLYADVPTTIPDYFVWLKTLVLIKSTRYKSFKNKFTFRPQTP